MRIQQLQASTANHLLSFCVAACLPRHPMLTEFCASLQLLHQALSNAAECK